ncbi:MAG TPA: FAD-dependent oxidoreductase [Gemmatimonadaceae bacterium]
MSMPHVVVLGAGPAGCGAAFQLRRTDRARVTVLERQHVVGGNAGSFEWAGQHLDYGSHRLHYACDPRVLADIRELLDGDLLARRRNGRIRLRGRFIRFPLQAADLMLRLDRAFAAGAMRDLILSKITRRGNGDDSFASVLLERLGPTICHGFYFPYARKIWGRDPAELSGTQARRRVTANSFSRLLQRVARPAGKGMFHYPRRGFGQITTAFAERAQTLGAEFLFGSMVHAVELPATAGQPWRIVVERNGERQVLCADHLWSTIPITQLARLLAPAPPAGLLESATRIDYRAMILVYLQLDVHRFTETDAHYFPESDIAITRLSEPKNYSGATEPRGSTVLCAELPCAPDDAVWSMSDAELGALVARDIRTAGLPLTRPPVAVHVRRLRHAYPIYGRGYEVHFDALDRWLSGLPGLLTFGRQGLFAHDNTHHALYMAYAAVDCLRETGFDADRWAAYRAEFATHVVED